MKYELTGLGIPCLQSGLSLSDVPARRCRPVRHPPLSSLQYIATTMQFYENVKQFENNDFVRNVFEPYPQSK